MDVSELRLNKGLDHSTPGGRRGVAGRVHASRAVPQVTREVHGDESSAFPRDHKTTSAGIIRSRARVFLF